ncbi:MAG: hypothetical protein ACKO2T_19705 [Microcystis aeruginosa]
MTPSFNTIEKLGLNLNKIKALRQKAIEPFLDEEIDNAQLKVFVNGYLCLDDQQRSGVLLNRPFSLQKYNNYYKSLNKQEKI